MNKKKATLAFRPLRHVILNPSSPHTSSVSLHGREKRSSSPRKKRQDRPDKLEDKGKAIENRHGPNYGQASQHTDVPRSAPIPELPTRTPKHAPSPESLGSPQKCLSPSKKTFVLYC
ncbi:hypothetical protein V5799_004164 [Amblyomma americanum]|uniref:Uncharacterized protein n=1 Tax=Amblyomma americanum TaxID=6943 RepID=A0AAQ4D6W4_AMBAM